MTKFFSPKKIRNGTGSPCREYFDGFFYEYFPKLFFQKEISILDIGCGSGYVRKIFEDLGYKIFYTGVDVKKHFDFDKFGGEFVNSKIEDFNIDKKFDLIISICALEHIKNDVLAISKAKEFMKEDGIQVHIVPTHWSFPLYLHHGYRRYGVARLRKLFGNSSEIYRVGGLFSFILHFFLITIPKRIFNSKKSSKIYLGILNISNKLDFFLPILSPMYIVIKRNGNSK